MFLALYHPKDCPYCNYLKDVLDSVQKDLGDNNISFGLIDIETHTDVNSAEKIRETPLVKLFAGGKYYTYFMNRLGKESIQEFLESILASRKKATYIAEERDFVKFNNHDYSFTLSFPSVTEDTRQQMDFFQRLYPAIPIFYTQTDSKFHKRIFEQFGLSKPYHALFKRDFDEGDKPFSKLTEFDVIDIVDSVWMLKDPIIRKVTHNDVDNLLAGKFVGMILFDKTDKSPESYLLTLEANNDKFFGLKVKSDGKEPFMAEMKSILGVRDEDMPCLRIVDFKDNVVRKYRFEGTFNRDSVKEFLLAFKENRLTPYVKDAPPVSNKGKTIWDFNRSQYLKTVADHEVTSVIGFVAGRCSGCDAIISLLTNTKHGLENKQLFVFAIVNLDYNEVDGVDPSRVPSIFIARKGKVKEYFGTKTVDALSDELRANVVEEL